MNKDDLPLKKWEKTYTDQASGKPEWKFNDTALDAFSAMLELLGFSLPEFDNWLIDLPDCPMKMDMLERRLMAYVAFKNRDTRLAKTHLEVMKAVKFMDKREQFLLPKAQRDEKRQEGTTKERRPKITKWIIDHIKNRPQATRDELWEDAPDWIKDQIGKDRFKKRVSEQRKKIKKVDSK